MKELVEKYNLDWRTIAGHFADRSESQCQRRWTKVLDPDLIKGAWTKEVCYMLFFCIRCFIILCYRKTKK